jgi:hypothetical protein
MSMMVMNKPDLKIHIPPSPCDSMSDSMSDTPSDLGPMDDLRTPDLGPMDDLRTPDLGPMDDLRTPDLRTQDSDFDTHVAPFLDECVRGFFDEWGVTHLSTESSWWDRVWRGFAMYEAQEGTAEDM